MSVDLMFKVTCETRKTLELCVKEEFSYLNTLMHSVHIDFAIENTLIFCASITA